MKELRLVHPVKCPRGREGTTFYSSDGYSWTFEGQLLVELRHEASSRVVSIPIANVASIATEPTDNGVSQFTDYERPGWRKPVAAKTGKTA